MKQMLIRYGLVAKKGKDIIPNFDEFDCCKEHPLCKYLYDSKKFFKRSEIELMSAKLGYSVWDCVGGNEGCQCKWESFVVTEK